jgi:ribosomal protein S18 acetylase RimI-like enzyme
MGIIDAISEDAAAMPALSIVPCSRYTSSALSDLYNRTRIDYIVPMPMNARRLDEYVRDYDVNLDASVVVENSEGERLGIGMLGLRGERAWITRLGIAPEQRGNKLGQLVMQSLLTQAQHRGARQVQLEVIQGNLPAYKLFCKLGFENVRELLVLNRPPHKPDLAAASTIDITALSPIEVAACLKARAYSVASWLDEAQSLLNTTDLVGYRAVCEDRSGWIICKQTRLQLSHFVLDVAPDCSPEITRALIDTVHRLHPTQDAKYENLPADSPYLPALQASGYIEVFRRIEMVRSFA